MRKQFVIAALVVVATIVAYSPSFDGEFVLDDTAVIENPLVMNPFAFDANAWAAAGRPLTIFSFALNHQFVGLDPRGWHLTNVAIHLAAIALAWGFARITLSRAGLSQPCLPALVVASLFALHPLQTESVAYITQRAESLASGLYLAALLLLLARDDVSQLWRRTALLAGAIVLHVMGLAAKPIVATMPVAWLLHSALLPASAEAQLTAWQRVWRRVPAALPFFAVSVVVAIPMIGGTTGSVYAGLDVPGLPPHLYLATQLRVILTYVRLLFWPEGQNADWYFRTSTSFFEPAVLGAAALLVATVAGAVLAAHRVRSAAGDRAAAVRVASFGVVFFLVALAPSSSVVPLLDPLAEHRVYLGSLGIFLGVSAGVVATVRALAGRGRRAIFAGAVAWGVVAAAAVTATARRSAVWSSAIALWSDAAVKSPEKARVHMNLGEALFERGRVTEALSRFLLAREIHDHTVDRATLLTNTVAALVALSRQADARGFVEAYLVESPRDPVALASLANIEFFAGHQDESERAALAALESDPRNPTALKVLGFVRVRRGELDAARDALRAAAATNPIDPYLYWELGETERKTGGVAAACAAYARSAALPGNRWISSAAEDARASLGCR